MTEPKEKLLDELLAIAERISSAKISDSMKELIFSLIVKRYKSPKPAEEVDSSGDNDNENGEEFTFNGTMKRFMRTFKISEDDIAKIFHLDPEVIGFVIPELKVKSNVEGVHHCILLIGVKNALQRGKYSVVINEVRELADNFGVYDSSNFAYAMKGNASVLKNYKAGKDSELSGAGIKAASELITELIPG